MRQSNEEMVANTIMAGFPSAQLNVTKIAEKTEFLISHDSSILIEIDNKRAKFNFPTRTKGEMHWSGILEGGPEQVGEMILRYLADAGYEVFRSPGKRIRKSPIRIGRFTFCPKCGEPGHIKEILYGLPTEDYDQEKYVLGGCCVDTEGRDPEISCTNCDWSGQLEDVRFTRRKNEN